MVSVKPLSDSSWNLSKTKCLWKILDGRCLSDDLYVVVGLGHDGKTLIFVDHMHAVFGSGFGCAPCSMLQTEREFQQQGLNFIHCSFMVFDESKRDQGIVEDQVKLFVGGGRMPLRRNHEADTKYAQWAFTGKVWNMNIGDVPYVPTAEERSHARRYRCTFMRSKFTNDASEVNVPEKIFPADPNAKAFMSSGEAVWCFYHDLLFPHIKTFGALACSDSLEFVKADSQVAKDTAWLLQRMTRACGDAIPSSTAVQDGVRATSVQPGETLIKETHRAFTNRFFSSVGCLVCQHILAQGVLLGLCSLVCFLWCVRV